MLKRSFLFALGLGIATSAVIGLLDTYLPYSETKIRVMDAVAVLGALLAGLAYPQGVHTGRGAPWFGFWAMAANFAIYVTFWYVCLKLTAWAYRRRHGYHAGQMPVRRG